MFYVTSSFRSTGIVISSACLESGNQEEGPRTGATLMLFPEVMSRSAARQLNLGVSFNAGDWLFPVVLICAATFCRSSRSLPPPDASTVKTLPQIATAWYSDQWFTG
jgi:hypothetical protein